MRSSAACTCVCVPLPKVISSLSIYLFIEDAAYFLVEPQLTAAEKRSGRRDGMNLLREDEKFRWASLVEVDFFAGDQSVMAMRFTHGSTQLRFGDDFGLSAFKRELRRLLPAGINAWQRAFGYHVGASASGNEGDDDEDTDVDSDAAKDDGPTTNDGQGGAEEEDAQV